MKREQQTTIEVTSSFKSSSFNCICTFSQWFQSRKSLWVGRFSVWLKILSSNCYYTRFDGKFLFRAPRCLPAIFFLSFFKG